MSPFASLFKKKSEDWVAREAVRQAHELSLSSLPFISKGVWQILLNDLQAGRIMSPSHGVLIKNLPSHFEELIFNWTAPKGKRGKEQRMLKYGARLLQEIISACDGNICYPINIFSENEIREAIHGVHHLRDGRISKYYMATYEDRPIFMKCYSNYMATCEDGRIFIKCLSENDDYFFNEITTAVQLNHRNVLKLMGCCFEMEFQILIFELVPNNLSDLLHQYSQGPIAKANSQGPLAWENRLRMAIEIADAVTYLHIAKPRPIIHRAIRSRNILLDEYYRPKLCDFSISIAIPLGETQVEATTVVGLVGYLDPHYLNTRIVTEKVDVYSFGWLLLELLSGSTPNEIQKTEGATKQVLEKVKSLALIFYANLPIDTRKIEQLMACIELAGRCIDQVPDQRPAMKEVALQLRHIEEHQIPCSSCSASSSSRSL